MGSSLRFAVQAILILLLALGVKISVDKLK